jgi:hypothetical protein
MPTTDDNDESLDKEFPQGTCFIASTSRLHKAEHAILISGLAQGLASKCGDPINRKSPRQLRNILYVRCKLFKISFSFMYPLRCNTATLSWNRNLAV